MKRQLFALLATVLALPAWAETPEPVDAWTGAHATFDLGAQWGSGATTTGTPGYNADAQRWDYGHAGFLVAGEVGYDHAWKGLVFGSAFELGYVGLNGRGAQPGAPGDDTFGESGSNLFAALRVRAGMTFDPWLFYATVGLIGVNATTGVVDACEVAPCGGGTLDAQSTAFRFSYLVGVGVERRIDPTWSVKAEYLRFDLGSRSFSGTTNLGVAYDWNAETSGNILRVGLVYRLGSSNTR